MTLHHLSLALCLGALGLAPAARADAFKSQKECTAGKRVTDRQNRPGTVVKIANDSLCQVKMDESDKEEYFIFWMLTESGKSSQPAVKLVPGTYECYQSGQYTFMDMYITGANTYKSEGGSGTFRMGPANKLIFDSGPLVKYTSKVDAGPAIMLSTNGGSFYGTSCELKKK
jgi:hypothetical protein